MSAYLKNLVRQLPKNKFLELARKLNTEDPSKSVTDWLKEIIKARQGLNRGR
jgi:hypothetical protein